MFYSLQFYIQAAEVWHFVSKKSNSFHFFIISKNAENVSSPQKQKITCKRTKISAKLFPNSSILHGCAQVNLHNCIAIGRKRFDHYFLDMIPLHYFHQDNRCVKQMYGAI